MLSPSFDHLLLHPSFYAFAREMDSDGILNIIVKAKMPEEKADHTACAIYGKLHIFGGYDANHNPSHTTYEYDQSSDKWTQLDDKPGSGTHSPVAVVVNGKAYIFGGSKTKEPYIFDPSRPCGDQ